MTRIVYAEPNFKSETKRLNHAWIRELNQCDIRRCDVVQRRVPAWQDINYVAAGGAEDGERFPTVAAVNVQICSGDEDTGGMEVGPIRVQAV